MSNVPGPSMGLNELMNAFTQEIIQERKTEQRYMPLRPSSAGKCEKELGYEYMQYKGYATYPAEPGSPDVHRLLNLGHSVEYHANNEMRAAFAKSPKPIRLKYKQQSVSICRLHDNTLIEGNIDLWIETADWRCLADWKSKSDKYSQFYKSSWDEFVEKLTKSGNAVSFGDDAVFITDLEKFLESYDDPFFKNNLYQLNMYGTTEFAKERNLTFCSIFQYNKNDSRIREIRFTPNDNVAKQVISKFQRVAQVVDTEKSIENLNKDFLLGSMKCGFCDFKKQCWPEEDALKAYFKELPPRQWAKDFDRLRPDVQEQLLSLFSEYHALSESPKNLEKIEGKIVAILDKHKVYKIRLNKDQIYRVKRLKSGGPKDGDRLVLRRDKA